MDGESTSTRDRAALTHRIEAGAGAVVIKAVLTGCQVQCSHCREWLPLSRVGLRIFQSGDAWEVRNQPRCVRCRGRKPEADDAPSPGPEPSPSGSPRSGSSRPDSPEPPAEPGPPEGTGPPAGSG